MIENRLLDQDNNNRATFFPPIKSPKNMLAMSVDSSNIIAHSWRANLYNVAPFKNVNT